MEGTDSQEQSFESSLDLVVKGALIELDKRSKDQDQSETSNKNLSFLEIIRKISLNSETRSVGAYLVLETLRRFIENKRQGLLNKVNKEGNLSLSDINISRLMGNFGSQILEILKLYYPQEDKQFDNFKSPLDELSARLKDLILNSLFESDRKSEAERIRTQLSKPNLDIGSAVGDVSKLIQIGIKNYRRQAGNKIYDVNELIQQSIQTGEK